MNLTLLEPRKRCQEENGVCAKDKDGANAETKHGQATGETVMR